MLWRKKSDQLITGNQIYITFESLSFPPAQDGTRLEYLEKFLVSHMFPLV